MIVTVNECCHTNRCHGDDGPPVGVEHGPEFGA